MSQNVPVTRIDATASRYLQLVSEKIRTGDSNTELAKRYGVNRKTVQRALDWGRDNGFFDVDMRERLHRHILEFNKHLDWIHEELDLAVGMTRNKQGKRAIPIHPQHFAVLSREMRECRTKILELEGLYKKVVNIRPVEGEGEEDGLAVEWVIVDPDEES